MLGREIKTEMKNTFLLIGPAINTVINLHAYPLRLRQVCSLSDVSLAASFSYSEEGRKPTTIS